MSNDEQTDVAQIETVLREEDLVKEGAHKVDKVLVTIELIKVMHCGAERLEHLQHFLHRSEAIEERIAHNLVQFQRVLLLTLLLRVKLLNPLSGHLFITRLSVRLGQWQLVTNKKSLVWVC